MHIPVTAAWCRDADESLVLPCAGQISGTITKLYWKPKAGTHLRLCTEMICKGYQVSDWHREGDQVEHVDLIHLWPGSQPSAQTQVPARVTSQLTAFLMRTQVQAEYSSHTEGAGQSKSCSNTPIGKTHNILLVPKRFHGSLSHLLLVLKLLNSSRTE